MASDRYDDPGLSSLRSPAHDVRALAAALADPRIGGFEVEDVFNRRAHEVNAAIEDFFCDKRPDDVLLLYVSCHGVKDDAGRLYFATANTRVNRLGSTGVASTFVSEQMSHSMSRNIILLLDCCYSGAFVEGMVARSGGNVGINERLSGSGRAVLSSSSALEYAFELDQQRATKEISHYGTREGGGRPSIFTEALVRGLTTGEADRNRDGLISIDELYDYTYSQVTAANPNQTPTKFSDVSGELIVAYSPGTVRPPALPEEVSSAAGHPLAGVRAAAVGTLKDLALAGDGVGLLAYRRLRTLLADDSRMVAGSAAEAVAEIERVRPFREQPRPPVAPPGPGPGQRWTPPARWEPPAQPPAALPFSPPPAPASSALGPKRPERLHGRSVMAYFMPFFTSLVLLFGRSRNVRYHAMHCALIDALTIVYFFAMMIPFAIYTGLRYGSDPAPDDDPFLTVIAVAFLVLPFMLRGYCLVQLARQGTARIKFLGALAERVAYGARRSPRNDPATVSLPQP
ncbi:caspase family protein [Actinomadura sp. WMMA1423]|uniref:caspase, EACC1-associated type n=1 Tax=Actinomadura sp. WMMA1423 TaxID=2591108 RepID=UPI00143CCFE3|nr:caspase family protein [Actinomadura sp. WMMA1423]